MYRKKRIAAVDHKMFAQGNLEDLGRISGFDIRQKRNNQ